MLVLLLITIKADGTIDSADPTTNSSAAPTCINYIPIILSHNASSEFSASSSSSSSSNVHSNDITDALAHENYLKATPVKLTNFF